MENRCADADGQASSGESNFGLAMAVAFFLCTT